MKKILCIVLALIMCFGSTLNIFAKAEDTKYISDIKIGYGDSGKAALIAAGYIVNENFNANEGGRGDSVWIGFMETDDPFDAITDISVMRMNGSYSFSDWEGELAKLQEEVDALLEDFMNGIEEFRTNFAEHSPYAEYALELLNCFTDDFTGACIGDLLLSKNSAEEDIKNVFLMGNMEYVSIIELCIAMACTEWKDADDTFITRLGKNGYAKEFDFAANHQRDLIADALLDMQSDFKDMENIVEGYEAIYKANTDEYRNLDEYVEKTCAEGEIADYQEYTTVVNKIKNIVIVPAETDDDGNTIVSSYTFYDLLMKDSKEWKEEDYETLRLAMTKGQIGTLAGVGLCNLILFEEGTHSEDTMTKIDTVMESFYELDCDTVSVYYGVDTTVFTDPSSVALTSAAKREMDGNNTSSFGVKKEEEESYVYAIVAGACLAVCAACVAGIFYLNKLLITPILIENSACTTALQVGRAITKAFGRTAIAILVVIAIVAVAVMLIMIVKGANDSDSKEPDDIQYTQIPRAMVDLIETDGEKTYYTYTAAKRIDADEDSENSLEIYGDLNGYNKKNEWVAVYYSKNRDLGNPITSDVLVNPSEVPASGYTAFHEFGESAATDLNKCNSGKDAKELYVYVKTTTFKDADESEPQEGSVFTEKVNIISAALMFVLGALIAGVVTYKQTKKKCLKEV